MSRFALGGNTHYGWIGVNLDANLLSGTVTGYAYAHRSAQKYNIRLDRR